MYETVVPRSVRLSEARIMQVPMETRGGVADYDAGLVHLTYHASSQAPHFAMSSQSRIV